MKGSSGGQQIPTVRGARHGRNLTRPCFLPFGSLTVLSPSKESYAEPLSRKRERSS